MSGTPRKLPAPLLYFKGTATRVISTALEQVQVESDGWRLFGPAPESDRFVLLSEVQALLGGAASTPSGQRYITAISGHAYFDPAGAVSNPAPLSIVNGHLVVETGA